MFSRATLVISLLLLGACTTTSTSFTTPYSTGSQSDTATQEYQNKMSAQSRLKLGLQYLQNGMYDKAKINLDKAYKHDPDSQDVLWGLGWYYENVDEKELAENHYKKALKMNRKNPALLNQYGRFLCRNGQIEKSLELFLQSASIRTNTDISSTYENAATCTYMADNKKQAEQYYKRSLNHNPLQPGSLLGLARVEYDKNMYESANKYIKMYEAVGTHSSRTLWLALRIESKLNNMDGAASYGIKLEQLFPYSSETEQFLENKSTWLR